MIIVNTPNMIGGHGRGTKIDHTRKKTGYVGAFNGKTEPGP